jgi:acetylornithine deacetylase
MEAERDEAWGLVGTWGGTDEDAPTVVLNGHLDVSRAGPRAVDRGPWSGAVRDGAVLGRGACDMKGGLACQVMAVEVLRRAGVQLRGGSSCRASSARRTAGSAPSRRCAGATG